mmetsp:Transcript_45561/g.115750  ORF Transcript_45561/g.115750 Transcript_45561/m.115750 type:complete len:221 (-) Transcript_45561:993-1655(-)
MRSDALGQYRVLNKVVPSRDHVRPLCMVQLLRSLSVRLQPLETMSSEDIALQRDHLAGLHGAPRHCREVAKRGLHHRRGLSGHRQLRHCGTEGGHAHFELLHESAEQVGNVWIGLESLSHRLQQGPLQNAARPEGADDAWQVRSNVELELLVHDSQTLEHLRIGRNDAQVDSPIQILDKLVQLKSFQLHKFALHKVAYEPLVGQSLRARHGHLPRQHSCC